MGLRNWFRRLLKRKDVRTYTDKEIFDYSYNLIKCAIIDYDVSQSLFKKKKKVYAPIIYHLQQSVEKLVKSEACMRKLVDIGELKEISHKSPKAFMMGLEKIRKNREINTFLEDKIPKGKVKEANRIIYNPKKIIKSSKEELLAILNFYEVFKKSGIIPQIYSEAKEKVKDVKLELNLDRNEVFLNLYFLSWITFPYAEMTRYPDGKVKPYEFDKSKPIVQIIPNLIKKIKPIIKYMESYKFEEDVKTNR